VSLINITIDYTPAHEQTGGIGRYVRDLISALAHEDPITSYRLFVAGARRKHLPPAPAANFEWRSVPLSPRWLARIWHRACIPIPVETFAGASRLYHATDFVLPPVKKQTRTLLTVHDLSFIRVPETAEPRLKAYLDVVVPRSVARANHILADSQATKADLIDLYQTNPDKVTVLLSGVDTRFQPADQIAQKTTREKYNLGGWPFIFSVGTVQPRKNYGRLIQALAQLRASKIDLHLVIAGGRGWLEDPIYEAVRASRMQDYVHFIGFADERDLSALYSAAECFVFPSLYEGFGLPILEAMACGTPVVTSNVSSLPEAAGDAALMIDPYDVEAITHAIQKLLFDKETRQQTISKGFDHIQGFTWERSARQLMAIYRNMTSDALP
jgi:glycosyltransferase involved in cell wall biosynthesis